MTALNIVGDSVAFVCALIFAEDARMNGRRGLEAVWLVAAWLVLALIVTEAFTWGAA